MSTETITQIQQPAPFIEAAAKPFLQELTSAVGDFKQQDLSNIFGPQFIKQIIPKPINRRFYKSY